MVLPTLMIQGMLLPPDGDPADKLLLDKWVPYQYILNWFQSREQSVGLKNRVLILKSETASGKSTLLPPEIYKNLVLGDRKTRGLICTQPRVLTAIENVNEMLKWYSDILRKGTSIGWSTGHNKLRPKQFGLTSATIGTLTRQLKVMTDEEILSKYKFILIDETHERDLTIDLTIYMLKNFLIRNAQNPECPFVVFMSATFTPNKFLDYFQLDIKTNFIWCGGETAGFDEMWEWNQGRTTNNYPQTAGDAVNLIVDENPNDPTDRADILIFMPGEAEIKQTITWLEKTNVRLVQSGQDPFVVLKIDGRAVEKQNADYRGLTSVPTREQITVVDGKPLTPSRRVIVSTNVAETGLTLENLKYVIDSGFNRGIEFNPVLGISGLITKPAPKSRVVQRRGRAGRKFRGVFYPLYPKWIFDKLPEEAPADILVNDIAEIFIDLLVEQLKFKKLKGNPTPELSLQDINMVDNPPPDTLAYCVEKLYAIGYLSFSSPPWHLNPREINEPAEDKFGLTRLGAIGSEFNLIPPESSRAILAAFSWGCSVVDMITMAAWLQLDTMAFLSAGETSEDKTASIDWEQVYKTGLGSRTGATPDDALVYKIRLLFADEFIDGVILFNAVKTVIDKQTPVDAIPKLKKWCRNANLSFTTCMKFIAAREEIIDQCLLAQLDIFKLESKSLYNSREVNIIDIIARIKYCIWDGYRLNILRKDSEGIYRSRENIAVEPPQLFKANEKQKAAETKFGAITNIKPNIVLYKKLNMKLNPRTQIYELIPDKISSMDGFVNVDLQFIN